MIYDKTIIFVGDTIMRILIVFFILIFLSVKHTYSNRLNDTFQVNKQSDGYRLGWNLMTSLTNYFRFQ